MHQEPQPSSSQGSSALTATIMGTLGRIRDTIALYAGFGSQSPPPSPMITPESLDDVSFLITLSIFERSNFAVSRMRSKLWPQHPFQTPRREKLLMSSQSRGLDMLRRCRETMASRFGILHMRASYPLSRRIVLHHNFAKTLVA